MNDTPSVGQDERHKKKIFGITVGRKAKITIENATPWKLFCNIMNDANATILTSTALGVGADGGSFQANWSFAHVQFTGQVLMPESNSIIDISPLGDFVFVWISNDPTFPKDPLRTPYFPKQIKHGSIFRIMPDRFSAAPGEVGGMSMGEAAAKDPSPPSGSASTAASSPASESPAVVSKQTEMENRFREALKLVGKDDDGARRLMEQAAEGGHGDAQNYLGNLYAQSRLCLHYEPALSKGEARSHEEAVKLFRLSAEQGNASGQCNLGVMYGWGHGVKRDDVEAVRLYRLSAEQGNAKGQSNLGLMYKNGHGVKQDYVEAVRLYRLSVEQGNAWAQCNLGLMYMNGHGVKRDYVEAVRLYRLSAEQGNAMGQNNVGWMYENGYGLNKDVSAAREWYKKAAAQGNSLSLTNLKRIGE